MKIGIAQGNPAVGDIKGNLVKIKTLVLEGEKAGAEIILFPELFLSGYPPEDLLYNPSFLKDVELAVEEIRRISKTVKTAIVVGLPLKGKGKKLHNSVLVFNHGKTITRYDKIDLPNYGVFDECRYFSPGEPHQSGSCFTLNETTFGLTVCRDIWSGNNAPYSPLKQCDIILNLSSSPFYKEKYHKRIEIAANFAKHFGKKLIYANLVGGQDELVFDGNSIVCNEEGEVCAFYPPFQEGLFLYDTNNNKPVECKRDAYGDILEALKLGLQDYLSKNGFHEVVIGLSGGVDSALTAAIAALALGKERVKCVLMPSKFSSQGSVEHSMELAKNLGIETFTVPIEPMNASFLESLTPHFAGKPFDTTEENLQARLRGVTLMSFSNKFNWLLLTTGNKSEVSVGYCTLYGDMCGGYSLIKDLYKTEVYELCRFINKKHDNIIPEIIITKEPSAELREDQKDSDSLPDYDTLDAILTAYIEETQPIEEIIALVKNEKLVKRIIRLVDLNEYKRRQAPPGVKISSLAFGKDRRLPITNGYRQ